MNCIDVHRKLTADPSIQDEPVLAHLSQCTACANFAKSIDQFEQSLQPAAKIDVPDGLAERILLKHNFRQQHQQRSIRFKLYAIAASLFLVLGISLNIGNFNTVRENALTLEEVAINHVIEERNHLTENKDIQLAALNKILEPFKLKFKQTIGKINYAGSCPIHNSPGVHIIVQEKNTTATLLLMPGEYVKHRRTHSKDGFTTTVIPTQNGSMAIVTEKGSQPELIKAIEKDLNKAIQYI